MTSRTKEPEVLDLTEELTKDEKRLYKLCSDLENLDRVDNEVYIKHYDKKHKWIHEGFEAAE